MYTAHRLLLDLALAVGLGTIVYAYQSHLPSGKRLFTAIAVGVGMAIAARFFLGKNQEDSEASEEHLLEQLNAIEDTLREEEWDDQTEEWMYVAQAAALATHLELWPRSIIHNRRLDRILALEQVESPEQYDELEQARIQCQFSLTYAYLQNDETEQAMRMIEKIRSQKEALEQTQLILLIELFYARALSQDDPEKGKAHILQSIEQSRTLGLEEDALQIFALEWLEQGFPEEALTLLEEAHALSKERGDTIAQTETLYQLAHAHCSAGHLQQAASMYLELRKGYVYINIPSAEQLDELHNELVRTFGLQHVQHAIAQLKRSSR